MNDALLSSKNMCWCTPPDFFAELDREFHFELDPASTDNEESRKPGTTVVMLIPSRTDTAYFHDWIFGKASEVRFLRGRLKFTDEDGNGEDAAPFPSAVIVWRSPESTGREFATWHI